MKKCKICNTENNEQNEICSYCGCYLGFTKFHKWLIIGLFLWPALFYAIYLAIKDKLKMDEIRKNNNVNIKELLFKHNTEEKGPEELKPKQRNKGKSLIEIPSDYTLIDIETTGLISFRDEIIELSAIKVRNNQIIEEFSSLVKPEGKIEGYITELTGITNAMVKNAPNIKEIIEKYISFIGDDIVVGYNVNFDINFIYDYYKYHFDKEFKNQYVDLMRICKKLCKLPNHKLKTVAEHYGISIEGHHRGLNDCKIELEVFNNVSAEIKEKYSDIKEFYKNNW